MEAKVIPIFSNKGGVGKTFCAVNIAAALAVAGRKVLLVDLDIQAGHDMARMLKLNPEHSLVTLLPELKASDNPSYDIVKKHLTSHSSGIDFISAIKDSEHLPASAAEDLKSFLYFTAHQYEYIIIDLGVSFTNMMITVLDHSDVILLVATPDVLAVYQLRWCIKMLEDMHFPRDMIKFLLNRDKSQGSVSWQEVKTALEVELVGRIPSEGRSVGEAFAKGVPSVIDNPRSGVADAFKKIVSEFKRGDMFFQSASKEKRIIDKGKAEAITAQDSAVEVPEGSAAESQGEGAADDKPSDGLRELKARIKIKLISKLELDKITPDQFTDPKKSRELRDSAKKIISTLLLEDGSSFVSSHDMRLKVIESIAQETFGLGVLEEIMEDDAIEEIMVNGCDNIYIEKKGDIIYTDYKFVSDQQLKSVISRIIAPLGRRLDESSPMVDARLQDGSRFNAIIPPLSLSGPCITIRKFSSETLTIDHIVHQFKSLSEEMRDFLHACVLGRMNIIVAGGTGSGKTALLNVLSEFIPNDERIITIEEAAELNLQKDHWGRLESRPANVEGTGEVSVRDLFVNTLRMRPDRIIIGECRGPEVLDMLQAMNTGHDGSMTSLHANSARDVFIRLSSMILLSGVDLPMRAINEMVSSAINVIIHMARYTDGSRKVTGISEITGVDAEHELVLADIFRYKQTGRDSDGTIHGIYEALDYEPKVAQELITAGIKLDTSIFHAKPKSDDRNG